jgi:hypothetical protein
MLLVIVPALQTYFLGRETEDEAPAPTATQQE